MDVSSAASEGGGAPVRAQRGSEAARRRRAYAVGAQRDDGGEEPLDRGIVPDKGRPWLADGDTRRLSTAAMRLRLSVTCAKRVKVDSDAFASEAFPQLRKHSEPFRTTQKHSDAFRHGGFGGSRKH